MTTPSLAAKRSLVVAIAALSLTAGLAAQAPSGAAPKPAGSSTKYVPPRLPDGQPDMQGAYTGPDSSRDLDKTAPTYGGSEKGERGLGGNVPAYDSIWAIDRPSQALDANGQRSNRLNGPRVIEPLDKLPYQPWAVQKKLDVFKGYMLDAQGDVTNIDPMVRCLPEGPPRSNMLLQYNGYQIVQPPGYVIILSEMSHIYRIIPLEPRAHLTKNIKLYRGDSRGHWEGNTLVVDTTNSMGKGWLDMSGSFYSDALHVVERYTLVGPNRIEYEATVEDPKVFTQPFKLASFFDRGAKDYEIYEYACQEGNHAVENLMSRQKNSTK